MNPFQAPQAPVAPPVSPPVGFTPPAPVEFTPPVTGFAPPAAPPVGFAPPVAAAQTPLYGQQRSAVLLPGVGAAHIGMDRLPRIPLGEHVLEFVEVECKQRRKDANYIAVMTILDSNRPEFIGQKCIFYQSLKNSDVALGQIKGFMLPLLGVQRNDSRFSSTAGDPTSIAWLDQAVNESITESSETGKGLATVGGTWTGWGTQSAQLAQQGATSLVGKRVHCDAMPSDTPKQPKQMDVFGDQFFAKYKFSPVA